jgi:hypothetical protein
MARLPETADTRSTRLRYAEAAKRWADAVLADRENPFAGDYLSRDVTVAREAYEKAWEAARSLEFEAPTSDPPTVQHQTGGCPPEQRDACVLCRKHPRASATYSGLRYETPRSDRPYTALYPPMPGGEVPDDLPR